MPQADKSGKQKRKSPAVDKGEHKGGARPDAKARAWASGNKLHGGGKEIGAGRKVPFGPVGGSGRKTNLARSS